MLFCSKKHVLLTELLYKCSRLKLVVKNLSMVNFEIFDLMFHLFMQVFFTLFCIDVGF